MERRVLVALDATERNTVSDSSGRAANGPDRSVCTTSSPRGDDADEGAAFPLGAFREAVVVFRCGRRIGVFRSYQKC